jgi:hypothetical protein
MILGNPDFTFDPGKLPLSSGSTKYWADIGNGREALVQKEEVKKEETKGSTEGEIIITKEKSKIDVGDVLYINEKWAKIEEIKDGKVTYKLNEQAMQIDEKDCIKEIKVRVLMCTSTNQSVYTIGVNGKLRLNDIQDLIIKILKVRSYKSDWYFNGKVQDKTSTIESLAVKPNDKLVCVNLGYDIKKFKRFKRVEEGRTWYMSRSSKDATTFVAQKSVLIFGFGMYYTNQGPGNYTLSYEIKFNEEIKMSGKLEVSKPGSDSVIKEIYFDEDKNPVQVPSGTKIGVAVKYEEYSEESRLAVGTDGNNVDEIEGNPQGLFTIESHSESHNGTGTSSGQIPELYYSMEE